jgi:hypothetical protein
MGVLSGVEGGEIPGQKRDGIPSNLTTLEII